MKWVGGAKKVKIVVFVPKVVSDKVREALGKAGAGKVGNYTFCSFSTKGIGRFMAGEKAKPSIGAKNKIIKVNEERIETFCDLKNLEKAIKAIRKIHPYEEPIIEIYPLYSPEDILER